MPNPKYATHRVHLFDQETLGPYCGLGKPQVVSVQEMTTCHSKVSCKICKKKWRHR